MPKTHTTTPTMMAVCVSDRPEEEEEVADEDAALVGVAVTVTVAMACPTLPAGLAVLDDDDADSVVVGELAAAATSQPAHRPPVL